MRDIEFLEYLEENLINQCRVLIFDYFNSEIESDELKIRLKNIFESVENFAKDNFSKNKKFLNMVFSTETNVTDVATDFESSIGSLKELKKREMLKLLRDKKFDVFAIRENYIVTMDKEGSLFFVPTKKKLREDFIYERLEKIERNKAENMLLYQ